MKEVITLEQVLNNKNFEQEFNSIIINNDKPITLTIEAKTIGKYEKKEICRFCYNIQDGQKINYYDGSNKPIEKVLKEKNNIIEIEKKTRKVNQERLKYKDYKINIKTKTFHLLNSSCNALDNVEAKYIQETTACEDDIIQNGFQLCKKCT